MSAEIPTWRTMMTKVGRRRMVSKSLRMASVRGFEVGAASRDAELEDRGSLAKARVRPPMDRLTRATIRKANRQPSIPSGCVEAAARHTHAAEKRLMCSAAQEARASA